MKKLLLSTSILFVAIIGTLLLINSCQKDTEVIDPMQTEVVPYSFCFHIVEPQPDKKIMLIAICIWIHVNTL